MKKIATLTASIALSAALATAASAASESPSGSTTSPAQDPQVTVTTGQIVTSPSEGFGQQSLLSELTKLKDFVVASAPLTITKEAYFYDSPNGKAWNRLGPSILTTSGKVQGDWVEVYTWLGLGWVHAPGYIPYP